MKAIKVKYSNDLLAKLLKLPKDSIIVNVVKDLDTEQIIFTVFSDKLSDDFHDISLGYNIYNVKADENGLLKGSLKG